MLYALSSLCRDGVDTPIKALNSAELLNGAVIVWHMTVLYNKKSVKQESKNIFNKNLKDVGMTVRNKCNIYIYAGMRAVYMPQDRR